MHWGNTLWDSDKYKTSTKILVPCHNNHAWAELSTYTPKIEQVYLLDNLAEKALSEVLIPQAEKRTTAAQTKHRAEDARSLSLVWG
jgi:hypothetical protein